MQGARGDKGQRGVKGDSGLPGPPGLPGRSGLVVRDKDNDDNNNNIQAEYLDFTLICLFLLCRAQKVSLLLVLQDLLVLLAHLDPQD